MAVYNDRPLPGDLYVGGVRIARGVSIKIYDRPWKAMQQDIEACGLKFNIEMLQKQDETSRLACDRYLADVRKLHPHMTELCRPSILTYMLASKQRKFWTGKMNLTPKEADHRCMAESLGVKP